MTEDTKVEAVAPPAGAASAQPAPSPPVRKPIEQWQLEKGVHGWLVAFAAAQQRWPQGRELTEAEFVAAIEAAHEIAFR